MIVVGSTVAPWKCDGRQELAWLDNAEQLIDDAGKCGQFLHFFAALEVDGRGLEPYAELLARMQNVWDMAEAGTFWKFALDDGHEKVESGNRLIRICMGRNLIHEYAMVYQASHALLLDSDITPDPATFSKLLPLEHPVTGGKVPIYALDGPRLRNGDSVHDWWWEPRNNAELVWCSSEGSDSIAELPSSFPRDADIRAHWNTAGYLLLERVVFSTVSWHYDLDAGLTDDPCFQRETRKQFGETWVRHDCVGQHVPIPMVPVEDRDGDRKRYPW